MASQNNIACINGKHHWSRCTIRLLFAGVSCLVLLTSDPCDQGWVFSRPKPVFTVQNGINWDTPFFPSFSRPKLGKTGKNYAALFFKPQKVPQNVMYQIKV